MICSNCGNPLASTDKFCSNCGTPAEKVRPQAETLFKSEDAGEMKGQEEGIEIQPPTEKFDWNVHTFPGMEPRPTEEIDFDWHMNDDDFAGEPKGEEIAFDPDPPKPTPVTPKPEPSEPFDTSVFLAKEEKQEEPEISTEPEEYAPPAEERKAGFGAPVFIGVGPKLGAIPEKKEESIIEKQPASDAVEEKTPGWTFDPEVPQQEKVVGPKMWSPSPPVVEPIPDGPEENILQGEELEKEIFEDIQTSDNPALARQTAKIDKFYTFNKKNEEFQKLLDKEYERFKGGEGEKAETFGRDVDALRQDAGSREDDIPVIYAGSQIEEMAMARELFFSDDIESEDLKEPDALPPDAPAEAPPEMSAEVLPVTAAEEEKNAEAFWKEGESEEAEQAGEKKKSGKAGTIVIAILSIILAALILLLAIRFFAPESAAAKKMDEVTNKVFTVFNIEDNTATAADRDTNVPLEDKTGLIQLELDKNQNGVIGTIRYNSSLAFDGSRNYGEKDINDSQKLTENTWYTDSDKKKHYYDRSLVGAVIAYESEAEAANKGESALKTLDIGEFRQGEKGYYAWVAEYRATGDQGAAAVKKVLLVTVDGEAMKVTESYTV